MEEGRANDGAGSKRNLSFQLQAVESTAKRLKRSLEVIVRNSAVGAKRRVGGQTDKEDRERHRLVAISPLKAASHSSPTNKPADLDQLLYMAGLEVYSTDCMWSWRAISCCVCRHQILLLAMLITTSLKSRLGKDS